MKIIQKVKTVCLEHNELRLIIAIIMSAVMTAVFFGMALAVDGFYGSDTPAHILGGMNFEGYGLETIFIYLVSRFASYPFLQLIVALYETAFVMATWSISQKFIYEFFDLDRNIVLVISTVLIFLSVIYIPHLMPEFYYEGLGTQPWHNSTYYGMRLMGVVYMMYMFRCLPRYLKGISKAEWGG